MKTILLLLLCIGINAYSSVLPIRVTGHGDTFDHAKLNAFRKAIEVSVGSVIISDKVAFNNELKTNSIFEYSAGYITNYNILSESHNSQYNVLMDVWVNSSKLAEYKLNTTLSTIINGNVLSDSINSRVFERSQATAFLDKTINDYPAKAFNVITDEVISYFTADRGLKLSMNVYVRWDDKYVNALIESLSYIQDGNSYNDMLIVETEKNTSTKFFIRDAIIKSHINTIDNNISIKVSLMSGDNQLATACYPFDKKMITTNFEHRIRTYEEFEIPLNVIISKNSKTFGNIGNITRIETSMSKTSNCKS